MVGGVPTGGIAGYGNVKKFNAVEQSFCATANFAHNKNLLKNFTQNGQDIKILTGQINGQGVSGTLGQIITNNQPVNEYYLKAFVVEVQKVFHRPPNYLC